MVLDQTVVPVFVTGTLDRGDLGVGPIEAAGGTTLAGVVAQQSVLQLFNNVTSDTVLRVRRMHFRVSPSIGVEIRVSQTIIGAAAIPVFFTDFRFAGRAPVGSLRALAITGGVAGNDLYAMTPLAQTPVTVEFKNLIIPSGFGVHIQSGGNQVAMSVSFEWDEVDGNTV